MLDFLCSHRRLFLILVAVAGFIAGAVIYRLTFLIPQRILLAAKRPYCPCLETLAKQDFNHKHSYSAVMPLPKPPKHNFLPAVLFCSTLLSVLIAYSFGAQATTAINLLLMWGLLLLAGIDFYYYLLPDSLTLPLLWLGLFCNSFSWFVSPSQAVWGAISGYLSLWLVAGLFHQLRKTPGMGRGDFKLLAVFGAWWGGFPLVSIVLIASLSGLLVGVIQIIQGRHSWAQPQPFGPYLILGGLLTLFFR